MVVEALGVEQTWRLLWAHATYQIVSNVPSAEVYEPVSVGYGWGLRNPEDRRRALVIHPTADGREIGDLSLTILGVGTQIIPRCGASYVDYLEAVADVVETSANAYIAA